MAAPKTNKEKVIKISVEGHISNPESRGVHGFDADGKLFLTPGTGGIVYNVQVGDSAFGWAGDHIEPCVSTLADGKNRESPQNRAYNLYSCTGNEALIVSGDAKDTKGVVLGHHGGAEHVIIQFPIASLEKMTLDTKILVKGYGQGLELTEYEDIKVYNLDPGLIEKWGIEDNPQKGIKVPVTKIIPGELMGSGVGSVDVGTGDYDIMTADTDYIRELGLDELRFGDFVAIENHDNRYGRCFRKGSVTIGIVIHSDCKWSGHGPGITTLLSTHKTGLIEYFIDPGANLGRILKIGRFEEIL